MNNSTLDFYNVENHTEKNGAKSKILINPHTQNTHIKSTSDKHFVFNVKKRKGLSIAKIFATLEEAIFFDKQNNY